MATNKNIGRSNITAGWPCGLALPYDVLTTLRLFNQAYNKYQKKGGTGPQINTTDIFAS